MTISADEIHKIAKLARIHITEEDIPELNQHLSKILDFVQQMDSCDTENVKPLAHPQEIAPPLRSDETTESNQRDKFQTIAPDVADGLYLVPKVID